MPNMLNQHLRWKKYLMHMVIQFHFLGNIHQVDTVYYRQQTHYMSKVLLHMPKALWMQQGSNE